MTIKTKYKRPVSYDSYQSRKIFFVLRNIYRKSHKNILNTDYPEIFINDLLNLVSDRHLLFASYQKIVCKTKAFFDQNDWFDDFSLLSRLVRTNNYPWGENKLVFIIGKNGGILKERIKIPSWIDDVVQQSMITVLKAIYEPLFDSLGCSFGYGCSFGVCDAILQLRTFRVERFNFFVKGQFSFSSDKCFYEKKFLFFLSQRIKDKKFLSFFFKRLRSVSQCDFFDIPFFLSIYLFTFDQYVMNFLKWRDKYVGSKSIYMRHAYEWVLFTDYEKEVVNNLINSFKVFSNSFLYLPLFINSLSNHYQEGSLFCFLGFDFKSNSVLNLKSNLGLSSLNLFKVMDRKRLFYLFYFKGFCNNKAFPREISFLTALQDAFIIEWFNLLTVGLVLYYWKLIARPNANFSQWLYIIKYSCLKTLAQKHRLTLRKVFKKYALFPSSYKKNKLYLGVKKNYLWDIYVSYCIPEKAGLKQLVYKAFMSL